MEPGCRPPLQHSPRREVQLQGPRPAPLRVSKDSHKIRKPPLAPPRDPVVIYTISPKVIHVELADFMGIVQQLTGATSAAADDRALSPAVKLASIQSATSGQGPVGRPMDVGLYQLENDRPAAIPGILSPAPASMPPVSPCFFSPSYLDPSFLSFLHDLSPVGSLGVRPSPSGAAAAAAAASGSGGSFLWSPGMFLSTPLIPSPGAAVWELFNQFKDFSPSLNSEAVGRRKGNDCIP